MDLHLFRFVVLRILLQNTLKEQHVNIGCISCVECKHIYSADATVIIQPTLLNAETGQGMLFQTALIPTKLRNFMENLF